MKERPILFSGPMVRAILEGRKTQTRRVVKISAPVSDEGSPCIDDAVIDHSYVAPCLKVPYGEGSNRTVHRHHSPWEPGDRLWVKETFRYFNANIECACYGECKCAVFHGKPVYRADGDHEAKWKPSIFCTRQASRITLEIVSVRVEMLQEISEEDAIAEGGEFFDGRPVNHHGWRHAGGSPVFETAKESFRHLWDSINGKPTKDGEDYSWKANRWVWVVEFKRVEG